MATARRVLRIGLVAGLALAALACGDPAPTPPPERAPGGGGETVTPDPEDARALGPDATFAQLAEAARLLDQRRDQDSTAGCLLRRGWRLEADLAVAVRPLAVPEADLDARLEADAGPVVVLSRWGAYGQLDAGRVALSAVTTTLPPRVEPATVWFVTDRGVWVRNSGADAARPGPMPWADATAALPTDVGALFVTAEAGVPLATLAEALSSLPDALSGRVGLAVTLAAGTRLPGAPAAADAADTEGLCPNGLPPLGEGMSEGSLRPDRIVSSLGPLRQGAEICVGATDGPGAAGGRVGLAMRIGPDGQLIEACVTEEAAPDPTLRACLLRAARATMFPEPDPPGAVDVALPLVLAPLDSQRQRPLCD